VCIASESAAPAARPTRALASSAKRLFATPKSITRRHSLTLGERVDYLALVAIRMWKT
jgi:hypothetical protein